MCFYYFKSKQKVLFQSSSHHSYTRERRYVGIPTWGRETHLLVPHCPRPLYGHQMLRSASKKNFPQLPTVHPVQLSSRKATAQSSRQLEERGYGADIRDPRVLGFFDMGFISRLRGGASSMSPLFNIDAAAVLISSQVESTVGAVCEVLWRE